jgi:hypothetical protein
MAKRPPVKPVGETAPKAETKRGRPTIYTPELAHKICTLIANTEMGLHRLHKAYEWFPDPSTILDWLANHSEFSLRYAQAKDLQAEFMADNCLVIADDSSGDAIETSRGVVENREFTSRSKLRVETRMYMMERLSPKKYGKQATETKDETAQVTPPPNITVNISKEAIDKLKQK